jgi:hypothetical protein
MNRSDAALTISPRRNLGVKSGFETLSDQRVCRAPTDFDGAAAAVLGMIAAGKEDEQS